MLYQQRESNRLASFCVRSNRCRSRWQLTAARAWTIHRHSLILRRTASSSKAWVESAINIILSLPILLQVIMFSVCCHSFYVNDRLRCKSCAPDRWPDGIVHPIRQHQTTARAACRTWVELLTRIANFFNLGTQIFLFLTSKDPHGAEKWDYADSIPGIAGQNYPILSQPIGATSFNCKGRREGGYYADVDSACQV